MDNFHEPDDHGLAGRINPIVVKCEDTISGLNDTLLGGYIDERPGEGEECTSCDRYETHPTKLEIGFDGYIPENGDWKRFGEKIGRDKLLKELKFYELDEEVIKGEFSTIFHGLSHNRSINNLRFDSCELFDSDVFGILTPLFKNNCNFQCLEINECELGRDGLRLLTSALSKFSSLEKFALSRCGGDEDRSCIQELSRHSNLRELVLRGNKIGASECFALTSLLQDSKTKLDVLVLADNGFIDENVAYLTAGLNGNRTLTDLDLSRNPLITEAGWSDIFSTFKSPRCRLEKLCLQESEINDVGALSLVNALAGNRSLKVLDLSRCNSIKSEGWMALFEILRNSSCTLEELHLLSNGFNDDITMHLAYCLANNRSLKSLNMSANSGITTTGWQSFSFALIDPHSVLERMCLSLNRIDDDAIKSITAALANNKRLKRLELCSIPHVTTRGWQQFSTVFQNPTSALEKLDLSANIVNDDVMISLANSLVGNKNLAELLIDDSVSSISYNGWAAISRVLCDGSSIMNTYQSNHTLQKLCDLDDEFTLPSGILSLLQLNR